MTSRLLALALVLCACPKEPAMPPTIASTSELAAARGKTVVVSGRAENAKLSAVVLVGEHPVYCLEIERWPDEVAGTTVAVEGRLEESRDQEAIVGPDGAISQGTEGPITVLRGCRRR